MKYFLYIILIFLILSWFVPIIPYKHKTKIFIQCFKAPCEPLESTVQDLVTLKDFINYKLSLTL